MSFFRDLQSGVQSPMFQGGLALLTGEGFGGMQQGMRTGMMFQEQERQRQQEAQQQEAFKGLFSNPETMQRLGPLGQVLQAMPAQQALPIMAQQMRPAEPMSEMDKLNAEYKRAQLDQLRNPQATDPKFGRAGGVFQGPDGKFYTLQFADDGSRRIAPIQSEQGQALTPAKGFSVVGDEMYNNATAQPLRNVGQNIEGAKIAEVVGKSIGEARTNLTKNLDNAADAIRILDLALSHPGRSMATGRGTWLPDAAYAGTDGAGFIAIINQIKGKNFLEAYQQLRGGGHITEVEGQKAEQAQARIDRAQKPEDFNAAVEDLRQIMLRGMERARQSAGVMDDPTASNTGAISGQMPQITSKDQFDQLPSGTRFVAPDGSVRIKP